MSIQQKHILIDNKPFYYNEVKLFSGRKVIDLNIAKENLQIFHSIIEQSPVTYGLFFGTLLGAIREKNFIAHDEDTDIYVLDEDKEKFLKLLNQFKSEGLEVVRYNSEMMSLMRNNEYIDIYFLRAKWKFGLFKKRMYANNYEYSAKNIENPIKQQFLGMNISMPDNPADFLTEIYGKNWRVCMKDETSRPNTMYSRISKMASLLKGLPFYSTVEMIIKMLLKKLHL